MMTPSAPRPASPLAARIRPLVAAILAVGAAHAWSAPVDDLLTAVRRDSDFAVRQVLRQGANVNARDAKGHTALTVAIMEKSAKVIPVLLQTRGININTTNASDESPLMLAIISGQTELANTLIRRGAIINKKGWTPLHYAATRGQVDTIRTLLDRDAYIDAESPNGTTPLMMAAQYGSDEAMQLLLDQGADPWARNQLGLTALDFARKSDVESRIARIQSAQSRTPDHGGKAQPLTPLTPAEIARIKGLPEPEEPQENTDVPEDTTAAPTADAASAASTSMETHNAPENTADTDKHTAN